MGRPALISHCLTGEARDRFAITALRLLRTIGRRRVAAMDRQDCRSLRRAPWTDAPFTHFASPHGEKSGLGKFLFGLVRDEKAQDMVEYALLAGFIAVSAGAFLPPIANSISVIFSKMTSLVNNMSLR
jgi:Flp pilus assembly pilin Flp